FFMFHFLHFKSMFLCCTFYYYCFSDLIEVTVHPGDDVILPCQADDSSIRAAEWTRTDLEPPDYILLTIVGHLDPTYQHPSFKDRLRDPEIRHGDVSVVLKNVSVNDTGTYDCRVIIAGGNESRQLINLTVTDSGEFVETRPPHDVPAVVVLTGLKLKSGCLSPPAERINTRRNDNAAVNTLISAVCDFHIASHLLTSQVSASEN
uniref:Ig-like domain-containing protein n=1 Tax=Sander lucioperca TaxID=283035 RepID=A0A8C9XU50_SANLU